MSHWNRLIGELKRQQGLDSPVVRWGVVCIVAIVLWMGVITPYMEWRSASDKRFNAQMKKVARLKALQSVEEKWKVSADEYRRLFVTMDQRLFHERSATAAQSHLQRMLSLLAEKHHLVVENQRLLAAHAEPTIGYRLSIRLSLHGAFGDGISFLDDIARNQTLLVPENLSLTRDMGDVRIIIQVAGFLAWEKTEKSSDGTTHE